MLHAPGKRYSCLRALVVPYIAVESCQQCLQLFNSLPPLPPSSFFEQHYVVPVMGSPGCHSAQGKVQKCVKSNGGRLVRTVPTEAATPCYIVCPHYDQMTLRVEQAPQGALCVTMDWLSDSLKKGRLLRPESNILYRYGMVEPFARSIDGLRACTPQPSEATLHVPLPGNSAPLPPLLFLERQNSPK